MKKQFLVRCACGRQTTRAYARTHGGRCKSCVCPDQAGKSADDRQARIIDQGWDGYAREEGHYDLPDYA